MDPIPLSSVIVRYRALAQLIGFGTYGMTRHCGPLAGRRCGQDVHLSVSGPVGEFVQEAVAASARVAGQHDRGVQVPEAPAGDADLEVAVPRQPPRLGDADLITQVGLEAIGSVPAVISTRTSACRTCESPLTLAPRPAGPR